MDLNYDYGDVIHTHKHIHTKPDSHRQVVEHALKEWCHDYFGEDGEEKCSELNEITYHDIEDGGHEDLKISHIFNLVKDFEKLSGRYDDKSKQRNGNEINYYEIEFLGSKINLKKFRINQTGSDISRPIPVLPDDYHPLVIEKQNEEDGDNKYFTLKAGNFEIKEDGIYLHEGSSMEKLVKTGDYDGFVVQRFKQVLRNLDMVKLNKRITDIEEQKTNQKKELKRRKHEHKNKFGAERKLEQMERLKKDRLNELIILVILWIVAILFGIYCIYTQFVIKLS